MNEQLCPTIISTEAQMKKRKKWSKQPWQSRIEKDFGYLKYPMYPKYPKSTFFSNFWKSDSNRFGKRGNPWKSRVLRIKQNPEDLSSGPQIWWTIRGSKTNRHLSTILGKEVIRIACRFVLKAVLKNALSPKNRMIYKGFRAPPTGFEPHGSPHKSIIYLP